ncbi:hypothetical protein Vafri_5227 [Volvox africanus]|uniref:Uncharacterized protein n=1 Tax=Volvox africanus TaxID=51714 RepID=A0A8J4EUS0_9CHLO|nr:hypothetical protein Vafri_5227 [Volvox africanus]
MGCLCFGGGKQDLSDLSAPLDPAVPKPNSDYASNRGLAGSKNGRQAQTSTISRAAGSRGATSNGPPAGASHPPAELEGATQQRDLAAARPPQRSSLSSTAAPAPEGFAAASGSMSRTNTGNRPQPLSIPDSPPRPPAPPKAARWDITPNEQSQQADEADLDDVEVDLEEVQELSPIPTASATPASQPASPNGGQPSARHRSGTFQQSPSNLGPGRNAALAPARSSTSSEAEDDGVEAFAAEAESPPPGSSPTALIYSQQQEQQGRGPFGAAALDDSHSQQQQQPARVVLEQNQSGKTSIIARGPGQGSGSPSTTSSSDFDDDEEPVVQKQEAQKREGAGKGGPEKGRQEARAQDEAPEPRDVAIVGESRIDATGRQEATGAQRAGSPAQKQQSGPSRPQSARKTATGPHAPVRPSPLGHSSRHAGSLARQDSNLSDGSDLSLPGEYERYGGGSSEDDEVADRQYEQAITAAGGQVVLGATARTSLAASSRTSLGATSDGAGRGGGPVASEPAISPGAIAPRTSGYENPMWREVLEEEDSAGLEGSPQSSSRPGPEPVQPLQLRWEGDGDKDKAGALTTAQQQQPRQQQQQRQSRPSDGSEMSSPGDRGIGSNFDSESESWSEPKSDSKSEEKAAAAAEEEEPNHAEMAIGRKLSTASAGSAVMSSDVHGSGAVGDEADPWARASGGVRGDAGTAERTPPQRGSIRWTGSFTGINGAAGGSLAASNSMQGAMAITVPAEASSTATAAATTAAVAEVAPTEQADARPGVMNMSRSQPGSSSSSAAEGPTVAPTTATGASGSRLPQPRSPNFVAATAAKAAASGAAKSTVSGSKPAAGSVKNSIPSVAKSAPPATTHSSTSTATTTQRAPAAPSPTSGSGLPHFMLPTRSAVAHRRPSEDGVTPISGIPMTPASGGTATSTATSAAVTASNTTAATPTVAAVPASKSAPHGPHAKAPSPATSTGASRPIVSGSASVTRSAPARQSSSTGSTPVSAPKPPMAVTTSTATAGPSGAAKSATGSTAKSVPVNSTASSSKPSPVGSTGTTATAKAASAAAMASGKPAVKPTAKPATAPAAKAGSGPASTSTSSARRPSDDASGTGTASQVAPASGAKSESQPEGAASSAPAAASAQAAAPPAGGGGGLPFGEWRMVRLKKDMRCCAADGTVAQETHDGQMEVFKCEETLPPGSLAAVISHSLFPPEGSGSAPQPKTWIFCPDPLCMESKPVGSDLPPWPAKIILAGGVKVTRAEYDHLKGIGLDVTLPGKAPAAAATASG